MSQTREQKRAWYKALSIEERRKYFPKPRQEVWLLAGAKRRALEKGLPFLITLADVVIPEFCPVLGLALLRGPGNGKIQDASPTIDRRIPELGYVPGNIVVISYKANRIRSNATHEELVAVAQYVRNHCMM